MLKIGNMLRQIVPCFLVITYCLAAYDPDKITNLPGIPAGAPPFNQYSGYLNATNGNQLHYWFVESQRDPATDPVILWLNGGPGCSSLDGYLSELGPFHVNNDGATLYLNEYSWNREANVIFLESPAGVGFSYSPSKHVSTNDDKTAEDNFLALQNFFVKFPDYLNNSFYITGESYGGIYIPTLAVKIQNGSTSINMQGFAIGNGLLNITTNVNSAVYFAYYHSLFDNDLWTNLQTHCCQGGVCQFLNPANEQCQVALDIAESLIMNSGINTYSIYTDCAGGIPSQAKRYQFDLRSALRMNYRIPERPRGKVQANISYSATHVSTHGFLKDQPSSSTLDCINSTAETAYLNRDDVRAALHIPASVQPWQVCSDAVSSNYTNQYKSVQPEIVSLLQRYRGLLYNGDVDIVCNFLGDQWFVRDLNRVEKTPRRAWMVDSQVAGFVHEFRNLTFATVKGSGHMVPQWRPAQAFHMIQSFLNNQPL